MSSSRFPRRSVSRPRKNLLFERVLAIAAVANLGLVVFDLSYVPWRDFWLKGTFQIPLLSAFTQDAVVKIPMPRQITTWYDPIKGIEPNRETEQLIETVQQLEANVASGSLASPAARSTLKELQSLSREMIDTDPFRVANKSGTLEKIKNRMRDRVYREKFAIANSIVSADPNRSAAFKTQFAQAGQKNNAKRSASDALSVFWSPEYLTQAGWQAEITWFNTTIRPLIQSNYYRTIDESGEFTNHFGILDTPFALLFLAEFLARTFYISRRSPSLNWLDAMLWRWYDALLFIPFWLFIPSLSLLRVIPVTIRLQQAEWLNVDHVREQATQQVLGSVANELTEVVVVQVIDQVQAAIAQGDVMRTLMQALNQPRVEINDTDEVAAISTILVKLAVFQVLPKLQPDLTALLHHNIEGVLNQAPAYQALKNLPGFANLSVQITENVVAQVIVATQGVLSAVLSDTVGAQLAGRLTKNLGETLLSEAQQQHITTEIQTLLNDLLEETKLSFVQRSTEVNPEQVTAEARRLRQIASQEPPKSVS